MSLHRMEPEIWEDRPVHNFANTLLSDRERRPIETKAPELSVATSLTLSVDFHEFLLAKIDNSKGLSSSEDKLTNIGIALHGLVRATIGLTILR